MCIKAKKITQLCLAFQRALYFRRVILLLMTLFTTHLAFGLTYNKVTKDISIPAGYTKMLVPWYQGKIKPLGAYTARYPSAEQNMQFMAFWNPTTKNIFYVQTTDPDGRIVDWDITSNGVSYILTLTTWSLQTTFPTNFETTDSLTAQDETEFYQKTALRYKTWAINQKWAKRKASKFDTMVTMAVAPDLTTSTKTSIIEPFIDAWGVGENKACWITYWRTWWQLGLDGGAPDYKTSRNLYSEFSGNLNTLNNKNCSTFPYTNAVLWDSRNKFTTGVRVADANNPVTATGVGQDGKPYYTETDKLPAYNEIYQNNAAARYDSAAEAATLKNKNPITNALEIAADPNNPSMKYMCPATQKWQNTFSGVSENIANDHWKGVYFDQAAFMKPKLCYDPQHTEHDIADPWAWQNGLRQILTKIHSDGLMVFTEGNAEVYMDLVDAFLSYGNTGLADTSTEKQVPLFKEVYGDIARYIGWEASHTAVDAGTISAPTMTAVAKKSASFGSMFFGAPYFLGTAASRDLQAKLRTDFVDLFDKMNNPQYKNLYERGGGALNWAKNGGGTSPAAINVVDTETGAAAVKFAIPVAGNGESYALPINETNLFQVSWDMKMTGNYYVDFVVTGSDGNTYYMVYNQSARNFRQTDANYLKVGLGADTTASGGGQWRTISRDLAADFYAAVPNPKPTLAKVNSILVLGTGLIDNLTFSNSPAVYSDGSSVTNWTSTGGVNKSNVYDSEKMSDVIQLSGMTGRDNGQFHTRIFDDNTRFDLSWDFKTELNQSYYVLVQVKDSDNKSWNLLYDPHARDFRVTDPDGITLKIGLGTDTTDGKWRTFRRNLADDLFDRTGKNIDKVISINFYANGYVDDVLLWGNGIRTSGR